MVRMISFSVDEHVWSLQKFEAEEAVARLKQKSFGKFIWLDICKQNQKDISLIEEVFSFHPLALEDCLHFNQRPKLEEYLIPHPHAFVVVHHFAWSSKETVSLAPKEQTNSYSYDNNLNIKPQEVHTFLGESYLVTVHDEPIDAIDNLWERLAKEPQLLSKGIDFIHYMLLDGICDANFPVLDKLSDALDDLEEHIITTPEKQDLRKIYQLRKILVLMRKTLSPQRDLLALLARHGGNQYIQEKTALYYRDVYDHLVRINEAIESQRDLLGNCVDTYLSAIGQKTNEVVKQLTILSSIMLPLSFVAGFFGMNFDHLPFHSSIWFWLIMCCMFVFIPTGMIYLFYKKRWL